MKRACALAMVLCWLVGGMCGGAWATEGKLLIVVLDKVTWQDLLSEKTKAPVLRGLAQEGAVGMMCVRSGRGFGGGYLTIGAGSRASSCRAPETGTSLEAYAFQANEICEGVTAGRLFRSYTGWPIGDNAVVQIGIGELMRQNAAATYPLRLGLLGGTLRRAGLHVAVVGNADTPRSVHRELAAIGMDEQGLAEMGNVGARLVRPDPSLPYRMTTDASKFLAAFRQIAVRADVIVLDLGETSRAEEYAAQMTLPTAQAARRRALERADALLGQVLAMLPREDRAVLVVTPNPREPDENEQFAGLTPVIFHEPGREPGLLTSPSTSRAGLVANTDVAPTVLQHFDVKLPPEVIGRPMTRAAVKEGALARLARDLERHDAVELVRHSAFRWLPVADAAALWASAILLLLGERAPRWSRALARALLLIVLSAPAALLLVGLRTLTVPHMVMAAAGGSLAIAFLSSWFTGWRSGHVLPALLVVGLLVYDIVKGQQMLYWSPLSYSPAGGARFYGVGNEYAGVLLGAGMVGLSALLSPAVHPGRVERTLAGLAVLGIAALVGLPRFGANLGMAAGCGIGAAVFVLYLWRREAGGPEVAAVLLAALALLGAIIVVDLVLLGPEASHIGRWAATLRTQGWQAVGGVLVRKFSMNWLLVRVSPWTDAAVAALAVLGVVILARPANVHAELRARRWLGPAVIACVAGAAAAFVLNDSGVVAAALALLFGAGSLAYVGLGEASEGK